MTYAKALVNILVSAVGALVAAIATTSTGDVGDVDTKNWLIAVVAVLGSTGLVWLVQNSPAAPIAKAAVSFLSAGIGSLVIALDDNFISQTEWLTAFSTAVLATGLVYQVRNAREVVI